MLWLMTHWSLQKHLATASLQCRTLFGQLSEPAPASVPVMTMASLGYEMNTQRKSVQAGRKGDIHLNAVTPKLCAFWGFSRVS